MPATPRSRLRWTASVGAGLLAETDETPSTMRFTHALVAHALYSELRGARRRRLHERAARVLEKGERPSAADGRRAGPALGARRRSRRGTTVGDRGGRLRDRAPRPERGGDLVRDRARPRDGAATARAGTSRPHGAARGLRNSAPATRVLATPCSRPRTLARRCGAADVLIRAALATDRGLGRIGIVRRRAAGG